MKSLTILLLLAPILNTGVAAQYRGGLYDGFTLNNSPLVQNESPYIYYGEWYDGFASQDGYFYLNNPLPTIYQGGIADGFTNDTGFNLNQTPQVSFGGAGDGFNFVVSPFPINTLPVYTLGGSDDGFDLEEEVYYLNPIPYIHLGGSEDGFDSHLNPVANSSCADNYFVWTGEASEVWHEPGNWECRVVPGIYSHVFIPEGLDGINRLYPIVYTAAEVSTIRLGPGAYMQIEDGVMMKLNGN